MAQRILPLFVLLLLAAQAAAATFQWEYWPLTGHALYAEPVSYTRLYFHRFHSTFVGGRTEDGVFPELRARANGDEELRHWCEGQKARPGLLSISGNRSWFRLESGGGISLVRDEPEALCGG